MIAQTTVLALLLAAVTHMGSARSAGRQGFPASAQGFEYRGYLHDPALPELSGLAASRRDPGVLWAVNDSGHAPELFALDPALRVIRTVRVEGVIGSDWEDLASFEMGGRSYLLIADTGDNFGLRSELSLVLVPEPPAGASSVRPERVIRFSYADGPRDCEAMAVDVPGRRILLADKAGLPAGLYELDLDGPDTGQVARRVADFPDLVPTPVPRVQTLGGSRARGRPTAMDLSPDGRRLVVLSYQSLTLFERGPQESWASALARPVRRLRLPRLAMFESLALSVDGRQVDLAVEGRRAHFYRWTPPPSAHAGSTGTR